MVKYLWGVVHVLRVEFLHPGSNQIALWTLPTTALLLCDCLKLDQPEKSECCFQLCNFANRSKWRVLLKEKLWWFPLANVQLQSILNTLRILVHDDDEEEEEEDDEDEDGDGDGGWGWGWWRRWWWWWRWRWRWCGCCGWNLRMSVYFLHVSMRQLRLLATGQSRKNPGCQSIGSHVSMCTLRLMATGQRRKKPGCQSTFYMFRCVNFVWWRLGKVPPQKKEQGVSLWCLHGLTRKLCLMAAGQSRKNPGCQSSVYMFWRMHVVWWPLGKAENSRMLVDTVYTLWCVNSVWWPLGGRR